MDKEESEYYCYFSTVDPDKKYVYSLVYARYPNQKDKLIVIGAIAISDKNKDQFVLQFFKDREIRLFFEEEILSKFNVFSEYWLITTSFKNFDSPFFVGKPYVVEHKSAEQICRKIHNEYEQKGYIIKDTSTDFDIKHE